MRTFCKLKLQGTDGKKIDHLMPVNHKPYYCGDELKKQGLEDYKIIDWKFINLPLVSSETKI